MGFYDRPEGAVLWKPGTITVSTVTGDAFIQPVPFIVTDNVVLLAPKSEFESLRLTSLEFIAVMINEVKWRYSYGRQCYMTKFATTEIMLPVKGDALDENFMQVAIESASYWKLVKAVFTSQSEDYHDLQTTHARLAEIADDPTCLIDGAELDAQLHELLS